MHGKQEVDLNSVKMECSSFYSFSMTSVSACSLHGIVMDYVWSTHPFDFRTLKTEGA